MIQFPPLPCMIPTEGSSGEILDAGVLNFESFGSLDQPLVEDAPAC